MKEGDALLGASPVPSSRPSRVNCIQGRGLLRLLLPWKGKEEMLNARSPPQRGEMGGCERGVTRAHQEQPNTTNSTVLLPWACSIIVFSCRYQSPRLCTHVATKQYCALSVHSHSRTRAGTALLVCAHLEGQGSPGAGGDEQGQGRGVGVGRVCHDRHGGLSEGVERRRSLLTGPDVHHSRLEVIHRVVQ